MVRGRGQQNLNRGIARRRKMCGLTQHELAQRAGIPVSKIVWIETCRAGPEPDELARIRRALKERAASGRFRRWASGSC